MTCEHKHIKCTNCVFICLDCGQEVNAPTEQKEQAAEKPKRRVKKGAYEK